jgi:hypothetical protein
VSCLPPPQLNSAYQIKEQSRFKFRPTSEFETRVEKASFHTGGHSENLRTY